MLNALLLMVWMVCNLAAGWLLFKLIMFLAPRVASLPLLAILGVGMVGVCGVVLGMMARR